MGLSIFQLKPILIALFNSMHAKKEEGNYG